MDITIQDYINNPSGNKNSVWNYRSMYRELYSAKFGKILVRESGKFKYKLYKDKDTYYAHIKVPSEVVPNFYYDTVIMFYPGKGFTKNSINLKKYNVNFYSNDPAFVYTFAHSFLKNNIFIKDLIPRMSKEAVIKAAKEKNPKNEVGYVKSIYLAYLWMEREDLFNANRYADKYSKRELLKNVEHADKKCKDREIAGEKIRKEKLEEKKKQREANKVKPIQTVGPTPSGPIVNNNFNHNKIISTNKSKTTQTVRNSKVSKNISKGPNFKHF